MKKLQIKFSVSGWVTTEVEVPDEMTAEELKTGLNFGNILTSIVPGTPLLKLRLHRTDHDWDEFGKVIEISEPDLEYEDFEVESLDN